MRKRVEAGSDIAKVGAWDASRNDASLANVSAGDFAKALETDAAAGWLFLVHSGGDGGGPVDLFIDTPVPELDRKRSRSIKGEFLISVPSGQLVVGGVEDYRSGKPKTTGTESVVSIPSGDYAIKCRAGTEEGGVDPPTRAELEQAVGVEDYRYFRCVQNLALAGYFVTPMVFLVLTFFVGWKLALTVSAVLGTALYFIFKQWTSHDDRIKRASKATNECWRRAMEQGAPTLIFELRRVTDASGLRGGSVHL